MTLSNKTKQNEATQTNTPLDYSEDVYKVYFEVGEYQDAAYDVFCRYLGDERAKSIGKLAHGYNLEIPIQCIPEITDLLCQGGIGVYQIIRYTKTDQKWL